MFVYFWVVMALSATFDRFPIALVFRNVGLHTIIPQQFPRCTRIKAAIGIEKGTFVVQAAAFHITESILEFLFELIAIVVVASNDTCRGNNVAIRSRYW